MAENEEDYLDGLLKSMSEKENAEKQAKDFENIKGFKEIYKGKYLKY